MTGSLGSVLIEQRLAPLTNGWNANPEGAAYVVASALAKQLSCQLVSPDMGRDVFSFALDLSRVRLKGMEEVRCIMVGGSRLEIAEHVRSAVQKRAVPGRPMFVFVTSEVLVNAVKLATADLRCMVVTRDSLSDLLESADPFALLKDELRRSLPTRSLIPYDILHSASGSMFFGRKMEFTRLRDEDTTSFALAGPGRAGKTSLAKHYLRSLKEERSGRKAATFFIDLMECEEKYLTGYMCLIANRIGLRRVPSTGAEFLSLLRGFVADLGQAVNLVLDEADDLCLDDPTSTLIATAARHGLLRLVLCGRGDLYRTMMDPDSHFAERLELLRIGPLDESAGRHLLVDPLADLGIRFADHKLIDQVLNLTGQFPHLLQVVAKSFAEYSIENGREEIGIDHLEALKRDHEIAQYFMSPLQDLRDPVAKLVALSLLRDAKDVWTAMEVAQLVGITLDRTIDLCNELIICNILTWFGVGSFRLANSALRLYAQSSGHLEMGYQEARRSFDRGR